MESTTIRCPNCRKKHEEPCPKRCGCGQSLLTVLAARRVVANAPREGRAKLVRTGTWHSSAEALVATGDNEW